MFPNSSLSIPLIQIVESIVVSLILSSEMVVFILRTLNDVWLLLGLYAVSPSYVTSTVFSPEDVMVCVILYFPLSSVVMVCCWLSIVIIMFLFVSTVPFTSVNIPLISIESSICVFSIGFSVICVSCFLPVNVFVSSDGLYVLVPSNNAVTVLSPSKTLAPVYVNPPVLFVIKIFWLPLIVTITLALDMTSSLAFVSVPVIFASLSNSSSLMLLIMIFVSILYTSNDDLASDGRYL